MQALTRCRARGRGVSRCPFAGDGGRRNGAAGRCAAVSVLLAAVVAMTALALAPAGAGAETLSEALAAAYRSNPTLRAQRAQVRATDELVPQALSGWRPTVEVEGAAGKNVTENDFSGGKSLNPRSVTVTLTQPLFRGGRTLADTRRARRMIESERARLADTEQNVLLDGVTAYMDVLRDQAVASLARKNEQRVRRQLEATEARFEVGEVTRTDVAQARARLAGATADRVRAEGDLAASRATYARVMGEAPGTLEWPEPPTDLPATVEAARDTARAAHPRILTARFSEKAARADVDVAFSSLLPRLELRASFQKALDAANFIFEQTDKTVEVRLTAPLYQAGAVYSQVRQAKEVAARRRIEVDEATRSVLEEVSRAWDDLTAARAQVASFQSQAKANEMALDGVRQEHEVGLRTTLDVLDAEQELFEAQVNLVRARHDVIVASYRMRAAIGGLNAAWLHLPVERYDVRAHLDKVHDKLFGASIDSAP